MEFDFQTDPYTRTPLFEFVAKRISELILDRKSINDEKKIVRKESDKYIEAISNELAEISETLDDLKMIQDLLIDLKPVHHTYYEDKNPAHHIRYHIENYLIRVYRVKDQILLLIKSILRLNVDNNLQLEKTVLRYLKEHKISMVEYWHHYEQTFKSIKRHRNQIAHRSSLKYTDISIINAYFKYKDGEDEGDYYLYFEPIQNEIIDNVLGHIDSYLKNIDMLLKITCVTLVSPFKDNYLQLVKSELNSTSND